MCLVFVCDEDERVVGKQVAPGACPYCGGVVQAMDVESQWSFCFLPIYFKNKRRYYCTLCARRLVIQ
nr:Methionyl-tRNA synthetase [Ipomoea batatas]